MQKSVTKELQNSIKIAFKEDQTLNDITSDLIIDPSAIANFKIILKEDAVVCGLETVALCLKELAQSAKFKGLKFKIKLELRDGSFAKAGTVIASGSTTTLGILAC